MVGTNEKSPEDDEAGVGGRVQTPEAIDGKEMQRRRAGERLCRDDG